jgi:hypothetical protein
MADTSNLLITKPETAQAQPQATIATGFDEFDAAIAGAVSKTIDTADVTLSDDEARNAIIILSGTLTGNRALIVPARTKIYAVKNGTSGAHTVTVKTSGGSGVVVTQGAFALVLCDGTNVVGLSGYLTVEESDGSPSIKTVNKLVVTPGALSDGGNGEAELAITGGSPGSGGGDVTIGAYGSRPAAGNAGAIYLANDGIMASIDNGVDWKLFGPVYALNMTKQVSDFTWVNQGSATAANSKGGIRVTTPIATGTSIRMLVKSAPTPPYTLTVAFIPAVCSTTSGSEAFRTGVVWRSSGDSKITYVAVGADAGGRQVRIYTATNETSGFSGVAVVAVQERGPLFWMRLEDDNTNRKVYISNTGLDNDWVLLYSVSRTSHHTPDQIGLAFDSNHATFNNISTYFHYVEA